MYRFFVTEREGDFFKLDEAVLKHIKVARLSQSHFICTYQAAFYECALEGISARIIKPLRENHEYEAPVGLALSLIEEKHWEWALQKATELGVTDIYPLLSAHTTLHLAKQFNRRLSRYQAIIKSAAEQSFRNVIPTLHAPLDFNAALALPFAKFVLAHEKAATPLVSQVSANTLFLVGPEGGFSDDEVALAQSHNVLVISLGARILRAETAAIALLTKVSAN